MRLPLKADLKQPPAFRFLFFRDIPSELMKIVHQKNVKIYPGTFHILGTNSTVTYVVHIFKYFLGLVECTSNPTCVIPSIFIDRSYDDRSSLPALCITEGLPWQRRFQHGRGRTCKRGNSEGKEGGNRRNFKESALPVATRPLAYFWLGF